MAIFTSHHWVFINGTLFVQWRRTLNFNARDTEFQCLLMLNFTSPNVHFSINLQCWISVPQAEF